MGIAIGGPNTCGDGVDSRVEAPDIEIGENSLFCLEIEMNTKP